MCPSVQRCRKNVLVFNQTRTFAPLDAYYFLWIFCRMPATLQEMDSTFWHASQRFVCKAAVAGVRGHRCGWIARDLFSVQFFGVGFRRKIFATRSYVSSRHLGFSSGSQRWFSNCDWRCLVCSTLDAGELEFRTEARCRLRLRQRGGVCMFENFSCISSLNVSSFEVWWNSCFNAVSACSLKCGNLQESISNIDRIVSSRKSWV